MTFGVDMKRPNARLLLLCSAVLELQPGCLPPDEVARVD